MKPVVLIGGVLLLAACAPAVPESNPDRGVGFGDYGNYVRERSAEAAPQTVAPPAVQAQPLGQGAAVVGVTPPAGGRPVAVPQSGDLGADVRAVLDATAPGGAAAATVPPVTEAPAPATPVTPLPERSDSGRPNIVAYAINARNALGQQAYPRSNPFRNSAHDRACAKYVSADQAQEAFLAAGGPERDGKSLDPDGDGFACGWDPTPFRQGSQ